MKTSPDINPQLAPALNKLGLDTVEGAFAFSDGEDLVKAGLGHRKRTRFAVRDESGQSHQLYIKRYQPEKLSARINRRFTYGPRMSPAGIEFDNIQAARAEGVPTMQALVSGEQWGSLGAVRSYIIVTEVPGDKLEILAPGFVADNAANPEVMEAFTLALAAAVRKFHATGYVHRDLYSSHFFIEQDSGQFKFYLIDLARAFRPTWRRRRWLVKDLAQLKFSMSPTGWIGQNWDQFLLGYLDTDDERIVSRWNRQIARQVWWMRYRHKRKCRKLARNTQT